MKQDYKRLALFIRINRRVGATFAYKTKQDGTLQNKAPLYLVIRSMSDLWRLVKGQPLTQRSVSVFEDTRRSTRRLDWAIVIRIKQEQTQTFLNYKDCTSFLEDWRELLFMLWCELWQLWKHSHRRRDRYLLVKIWERQLQSKLIEVSNW